MHKHKIEVKKTNASRKRKLARKRTLQQPTTMAKTRLALRQRRMPLPIRHTILRTTTNNHPRRNNLTQRTKNRHRNTNKSHAGNTRQNPRKTQHNQQIKPLFSFVINSPNPKRSIVSQKFGQFPWRSRFEEHIR